LAIERSVLTRPGIAAAFQAYRAGFDRTKSVAQRLYAHQRAAGNLDLFHLFAERNIALASLDGAIGVLMPSAFHANEGTAGLRRLYRQETDLRWCLSFENRRRIFDIDSRFKFDVIVAHRPGPSGSMRCGFYLDRIEDADDPDKIMTYTQAFLDVTGLAPLELRGTADLQVAETFFAQPARLKAWCLDRHIRFGCDLHMTADAGCFQPRGAAPVIVHEGKTFHQYTDIWDAEPRYSVTLDALKPPIAEATRHHRLVFRDIARSNDERTMIACIAPPGVVFGHTATVEKAPWSRPNADALVLCALFNSFPFDWLVRLKAATHLSLYILDAVPVPCFRTAACRFLTHAALLLSCNHTAYAGLWREYSPGPMPRSSNALLCSRIDAIVANAYGLTRDQYDHVLRGFSHRSHPDAPVLCLAAFDELRALGEIDFCRQHDPLDGTRIVTACAEQ
jgi:hypothetical protein